MFFGLSIGNDFPWVAINTPHHCLRQWGLEVPFPCRLFWFIFYRCAIKVVLTVAIDFGTHSCSHMICHLLLYFFTFTLIYYITFSTHLLSEFCLFSMTACANNTLSYGPVVKKSCFLWTSTHLLYLRMWKDLVD